VDTAPPIDAVNLNFVCESEIAFTFLFLRRKKRASLGFEFMQIFYFLGCKSFLRGSTF